MAGLIERNGRVIDSREYERWLGRLAKLRRDTPFFGVLGVGYEKSFYRAYFKTTLVGPWWVVESFAGPSLRKDPLEYQLSLPKEDRVEHVSGTIGDLRGYTCDPSRPALVELFERIREILVNP